MSDPFSVVLQEDPEGLSGAGPVDVAVQSLRLLVRPDTAKMPHVPVAVLAESCTLDQRQSDDASKLYPAVHAPLHALPDGSFVGNAILYRLATKLHVAVFAQSGSGIYCAGVAIMQTSNPDGGPAPMLQQTGGQPVGTVCIEQITHVNATRHRISENLRGAGFELAPFDGPTSPTPSAPSTGSHACIAYHHARAVAVPSMGPPTKRHGEVRARAAAVLRDCQAALSVRHAGASDPAADAWRRDLGRLCKWIYGTDRHLELLQFNSARGASPVVAMPLDRLLGRVGAYPRAELPAELFRRFWAEAIPGDAQTSVSLAEDPATNVLWGIFCLGEAVAMVSTSDPWRVPFACGHPVDRSLVQRAIRAEDTRQLPKAARLVFQSQTIHY
jgi:hypothetical protein